uniref:Uncharacterized protein n=1 Tax=Romanomermis culicivorax TaxID=13658 RepID=A0A915HNS4_ROMCU
MCIIVFLEQRLWLMPRLQYTLDHRGYQFQGTSQHA